MNQTCTEKASYRPSTVRGRPARKLYRTLWVSTDGRKQKIRDMNSQHIRNCLNLMDRILNEVRSYGPLFDDPKEQEYFMSLTPHDI